MFELELETNSPVIPPLRRRAKFYYVRPRTPIDFGKPNPTKAITYCHIEAYNYKSREWEVMFRGRAYCSVEDNFCKDTGRKIALANAIESYRKEHRRKFWEAYFEMTGGP